MSKIIFGCGVTIVWICCINYANIALSYKFTLYICIYDETVQKLKFHLVRYNRKDLTLFPYTSHVRSVENSKTDAEPQVELLAPDDTVTRCRKQQ